MPKKTAGIEIAKEMEIAVDGTGTTIGDQVE